MFQKIFISVVLSFSFLFFNLPASAINLNGLKNDSDSKTEQSDSYLQSKSFGKISQKYENKTNPAPAVFKPLAESDFESFISKGLLEDVETKIKQFGYDLFLNPPSTFAPADNIPLSSDYIVGPGDELRISVWGKIEGSWEVQVDRNGNIALPKV
ncbi:MAG: polysaccharide biosynthesis/export family protein, partial [Elusimicrobiales bacterium]|nr:polysaccharide biosynthesis/export family protein [Elusimicrobiales bacterium]